MPVGGRCLKSCNRIGKLTVHFVGEGGVKSVMHCIFLYY